ncbi:uncharacterized protein DUF3872 [Dysgonomonas alginatilytica]|uniref:Uncharacterized protein DUF3872 n=1 Tax=Dysgonomonas alginatilytica TaxID=1605892 RepID=A0A2V3PJS6_9BACT|nr:DUF3872 domain-containing protein [Dysgonomonas alginatilytica]PXV61073.1 uncharacterized protein DUF3872 [Dysgonomonas alginatilytica]
MKKFASYLIYAILIACIACACSSDIDIRQDYKFKVTHLPVPKKVKKGETIEIRCQLERSGRFDQARYSFRFFQFDGVGELKMDNEVVLLPNDYYDLTEETFRLYYTSLSSDAQSLDVYFFDKAGNNYTLQFSFNPDNSTEGEP